MREDADYTEVANIDLHAYLDTISPQSQNDLVLACRSMSNDTLIDVNLTTYKTHKRYDEELEDYIISFISILH